jgi:protein-S-isoprenylcysteine O-methyltransferase Ste14
MVIIRTVIFTILVPGSVTVGMPYFLLSSGTKTFSFELGAFQLIGFVPITVGLAFYLWCAWDFTFFGRGTPAPWDSPDIFVSRGLYRMVRNPMYVGVWLILLGEVIVFESLRLAIYAILVWCMFHLVIVLYEEPTLKERFGTVYDEYCKTVPRWIPRSPAQRKN